jgi:uncharacterized protein YjbJ (UPF0337 family)
VGQGDPRDGAEGEVTEGKRQKAKGKRQKAKGKRQKAKGKRQMTVLTEERSS